jgi:upstream activation factor subunit UAF30
MAEPSDDDLVLLMKKMVPEVDLQNTGVKKFTKLLSKELGGIDLSHRKDFIKTSLADIINSMEEEEEDESGSEEEEEQPKKKRRKSSSGVGGGGLAAVKEISPELAAFLGKGNEMARTEIVKLLWEYIREHNLQNPDNKREILLDDEMKKVFQCDMFTMFTMNKYIGAHVYPFKPVDLTTNSSTPKKKKTPKEKKPRKAGTQAPYQLSPELARVTGKQILPRPQVTKALWDYIKANGLQVCTRMFVLRKSWVKRCCTDSSRLALLLQNPEDKREIICDDKLKAVMGGKDKVTMFTMNKYVGPHLLEKLDKSYYTHEED